MKRLIITWRAKRKNGTFKQTKQKERLKAPKEEGKHDYEHRNSHGISIYIPYYYFEQAYKELLFAYYSQWDEFLEWLFEDPTSNPPTDPKISGPTEGLSGSTYYYSFVSTDPDGDELEYYIDWGDGTEWLGPEDPGTEIEAYHSWMADGAYIIKAKAYDSTGAESDWAYYTITMPKEKDTQDKFIEILLERVSTFFPFLKKYF